MAQMTSPIESDQEAEKHRALVSDAQLRKWMGYATVCGTALFGGFFLLFIAFQALCGKSMATNTSWLIELMVKQWPGIVGTPMSAISAYCIVTLLRVTNGPIEIEGFGLKFRGAAGPIVLWIFCFLALVAGLSLLWNKAA